MVCLVVAEKCSVSYGAGLLKIHTNKRSPVQEYAGEAVLSSFERSRQVFESLIGAVAGPDGDAWTHAELEERLDRRGRDLLRQIEQDRLDLTAARERRRGNVTDADGVRRTRVEHGHQRLVTSIFGTVTCTRMAYRAPGAANLSGRTTASRRRSYPTGPRQAG